jgi:tRNA A37 threonylcarbamoyltransferase TsaD
MIARDLGLGHPGGPVVETLAARGSRLIPLPYTVKGMSLSFSGFVTAVRKAAERGVAIEDLCYSIQETAFAMLAEVVDRAIGCTQKEELLVTGGVAANSRLREMLRAIGTERDIHFEPVPQALAGDNGAMIAYTGSLQLSAGEQLPVAESGVLPRWRTDEVAVGWYA